MHRAANNVHHNPNETANHAHMLIVYRSMALEGGLSSCEKPCAACDSFCRPCVGHARSRQPTKRELRKEEQNKFTGTESSLFVAGLPVNELELGLRV